LRVSSASTATAPSAAAEGARQGQPPTRRRARAARGVEGRGRRGSPRRRASRPAHARRRSSSHRRRQRHDNGRDEAPREVPRHDRLVQVSCYILTRRRSRVRVLASSKAAGPKSLKKSGQRKKCHKKLYDAGHITEIAPGTLRRFLCLLRTAVAARCRVSLGVQSCSRCRAAKKVARASPLTLHRRRRAPSSPRTACRMAKSKNHRCASVLNLCHRAAGRVSAALAPPPRLRRAPRRRPCRSQCAQRHAEGAPQRH
jgi:hypothetical protein